MEQGRADSTVARLPAWFRQRLPRAGAMAAVDRLLGELGLNTICRSALCPNIGDCFSRGTATFLILGHVCTRRCTFCAVTKGTPAPVAGDEPSRLLQAAVGLGLKYAVITSVTRDDLPDGGAGHYACVSDLLRDEGVAVELLVPDFLGSPSALATVMAAGPEVLNHNVETVPRLYSQVRPQADYRRSLGLLSRAKALRPETVTKSGLMLGLGETGAEVAEVMRDLRDAGCDLLTIGQYLPPSPAHHPVARFVPPAAFARYRRLGKAMGFAAVVSAPLVRSSFRAAELYRRALTG